MTVEEARALLAQDPVDPALERALEADPRTGIQSALKSLRGRRLRAAAERERLEELYFMEIDLAKRQGATVAGLDEVGRGPLAGPVVAACVILPAAPMIEGLDDSKALTPEQRETLDGRIRQIALGVGLAFVDSERIDRDNILVASLAAMTEAFETCTPGRPDFLLIDGSHRIGASVAQTALPGGDGRCACIAAASIVAKVARDRLMVELDVVHPGYGLADHKGYGTPQHMDALRRLGPAPIHRRSFAPVAQLDPSLRVSTFRTQMERSRSLQELEQVGAMFRPFSAALSGDLLEQLRHEYLAHKSRLGTRVRKATTR